MKYGIGKTIEKYKMIKQGMMAVVDGENIGLDL